MTTSIVEYSATEAALTELAASYKGVVYPVETAQGMLEARAAQKHLRDLRLKLEDTRKAIKAPALKRTQEIDTEARRITAAISDLEDPIVAQIKVVTEREKREQEARVLAEQQRIEAEVAAKRKAEEESQAKAREEIARRQAELDRQEAEARVRRQAEEARIFEEGRAARERIAEEERVARVAREEAETLRRAADNERLRLLGEAQAKAHAIRQREAEEASQKQQARTILENFVKRFGDRKEFAGVVREINKLKVQA